MAPPVPGRTGGVKREIVAGCVKGKRVRVAAVGQAADNSSTINLGEPTTLIR